MLKQRLMWTIAIVLLAGSPALAQFYVDSTNDAVDALPGDGTCATADGWCTLRAAIQEANADPAADLVLIPPGVYVLTITGTEEDFGASGDLDITEDLTLAGAGMDRTIVDGDGIDRVLDVPWVGSTSGIFLEILDLEITGGLLEDGSEGSGVAVNRDWGEVFIDNSRIRGNSGGESALSIDFADGGSVTLFASSIEDNTADGLVELGYTWAGIEVLASEIRGNGGDGLWINEAYTYVTDSTIAENGGWGTVVDIDADAEILRSTISSNDEGGIIQWTSGGTRVIESTLSDNGGPGALAATFSTEIEFHNSTVSGNLGGGVRAHEGDILISSSTITGNSTSGGGGGVFSEEGSVSIRESIIANNQAASGGPDCRLQWWDGGDRSLPSDGYNLLGNNADCGLIPTTGDQFGTPIDPIDPLLRSLSDNGGPTETHVPLAGSPAVDAIPAAECTATLDQRGVTRPRGAGCEIGAFERISSPWSCGLGVELVALLPLLMVLRRRRVLWPRRGQG